MSPPAPPPQTAPPGPPPQPTLLTPPPLPLPEPPLQSPPPQGAFGPLLLGGGRVYKRGDGPPVPWTKRLVRYGTVRYSVVHHPSPRATGGRDFSGPGDRRVCRTLRRDMVLFKCMCRIYARDRFKKVSEPSWGARICSKPWGLATKCTYYPLNQYLLESYLGHTLWCTSCTKQKLSEGWKVRIARKNV